MRIEARASFRALRCSLLIVAAACGGDAHTARESAARKVAQTQQQPADTGSPSHQLRESDQPIMVGDHSVIQTEAVGPLRVGEWRRPVMSFVYAISARAGRDSEDVIVVRGIGKDTVTLTFSNDTLRRVFVTHDGPRTASGIGVGTPFATLQQQPGVKTAKRGTALVASLASMCGVEFATDSLALSPDSAARRRARGSPAVRAISVGYCSP